MTRFLPGPSLRGDRPSFRASTRGRNASPPATAAAGLWLTGGGLTRGFVHAKAFTLGEDWVSLGLRRLAIHGSCLL